MKGCLSAPVAGDAGHDPSRLPAAPSSQASAQADGTPDDLGLSGVYEAESRLINPDGSFNARRVGLGLGAYNPYTLLLAMGWGTFFAVVLALYLLLNGLFALAFFALGPGSLGHLPENAVPPVAVRLTDAFFFSVQTFGTIGFGHVYPVTLEANLLVTLEAFVGLLTVALVTGMLFARFSRPTVRVLFSRWALVSPYHGGHALMLRLVNGHRSNLSDMTAEVVLSLRALPELGSRTPGVSQRQFLPLCLERSGVSFFPLGWTVVHPITADSPLHGLSEKTLRAREAEVMVIVRAVDETSRQSVQARTSYHASEIQWGQAFASMYLRSGGVLSVDVRRLSDTRPTELPFGESGP